MQNLKEYDFSIAKKVKEFYQRKEVQEKMFEISFDREVIPVIKARTYGKRPSVVEYVSDFRFMAQKGVTSFHASVERWKNPMMLSNTIKKEEMDELRKGWDLIIDIDANKGWEYGKIVAILLIKKLRDNYSIKNISFKFSGSRGFHIFIPFESLPKEVNGEPIELLFPEALQIMARYIKHILKDELIEIFKSKGFTEEMKTKDGLDPYKIVEVEEGWSHRHLFRMPYSFNEKTWLVSVPLSYDELRVFNLDKAKPENIKEVRSFFVRGTENEAEELLIDAFDFDSQHKRRVEYKEKLKENEKKKTFIKEDIKGDRIPKEAFPPCVKLILEGLEEGRKRALFVLIGFLRSCNWSWEEVEKEIEEWNSRNKEPLGDTYIQTQLSYAMKRKDSYLPPNCDNKDYYLDIGVCKKDSLCETIKNPSGYAAKRYFRLKSSDKKKTRKKR